MQDWYVFREIVFPFVAGALLLVACSFVLMGFVLYPMLWLVEGGYVSVQMAWVPFLIAGGLVGALLVKCSEVTSNWGEQ